MASRRRTATRREAGPSLTLRQLEYLQAVATEGSFAGAARACHVSQQALSEQIEKLEARLGALVVRGRLKCSLTPLGEQVVGRAVSILRNAAEIERLARYPNALRIGMIDTVAPYLMPALMDGSPSRILPVQARTGDLLRALEEQRVDGAVLAEGTFPDTLSAEKIGSEELLLAVSSADPLAGTPAGTRIGHALMADREMLLLSDGHCLRHQTVDVCRRANAPYGTLEASTMELLVEMVARDLGVTLVPAMALPVVGRHPGVRTIALKNPPRRTLHLVTNPGRQGDLRTVKTILTTMLHQGQ